MELTEERRPRQFPCLTRKVWCTPLGLAQLSKPTQHLPSVSTLPKAVTLGPGTAFPWFEYGPAWMSQAHRSRLDLGFSYVPDQIFCICYSCRPPREMPALHLNNSPCSEFHDAVTQCQRCSCNSVTLKQGRGIKSLNPSSDFIGFLLRKLRSVILILYLVCTELFSKEVALRHFAFHKNTFRKL